MKHQLLLLPIALAVSQAWADTDPVPEETVILSPVTVTGTQQQKPIALLSTPKLLCNPSLPETVRTFYSLSPT